MSKQHPHIKTLRAHNKWRRGDERMKMLDPKDIGAAIDWAIKVSELAEKLINAQGTKAAQFYDKLAESVKEGR